jgi:hypothetical protein
LVSPRLPGISITASTASDSMISSTSSYTALGRHRDDQQVELAVERLQAFDAGDAVDLGLARLEDQQRSFG